MNDVSEALAERWQITRERTNRDGSDRRSGPRWYAVHTLPHREFAARAQLEAQSYVIYLPHHMKTVRHARRLKTIDAAFFPRYLFVRLDLSCDRWRSINGTFGVAHLVMGRELPMPVPAGIVEALQMRLDGDPASSGEDGLTVGQSVEVMVGPFVGLFGTLERIDGSARVRVLLQLMGASTPVSLTRTAIVPRLG